jgi:hypothetical protein
VIGLIGIATDISERKDAQRELEKLVVAEQRLRAETEAPTAPRTSSSPSSRTSCARRSTRWG